MSRMLISHVLPCQAVRYGGVCTYDVATWSDACHHHSHAVMDCCFHYLCDGSIERFVQQCGLGYGEFNHARSQRSGSALGRMGVLTVRGTVLLLMQVSSFLGFVAGSQSPFQRLGLQGKSRPAFSSVARRRRCPRPANLPASLSPGAAPGPALLRQGRNAHAGPQSPR